MRLEITDYEKLSLKGRFLFLNQLEKLDLDYAFPNGPYREIVVLVETNLMEKVGQIFYKILERNSHES